MSKILLSLKKINNLKEELKILEDDLLSQTKEQIKRGGLLDSWHETASFGVTEDTLKSKVVSLRKIIKKAKILPYTRKSKISVLGSYLILINNKNKIKYRLVHPIESDPQNNKLSIESPFGKVLLNKKVNDKIVFNNNKYIIIDIN